MTTFTETWTGSNSSAWAASWTVAAPTGGINDIQSNAGRQVSGSVAGQGPNAFYNVNTSITDFDLRVNGTYSIASQYVTIQFRGSTPVANRAIPSNGYVLYLDGAAIFQILGLSGGSPVGLGSTTVPIGPNPSIRLLVVGPVFHAKAWNRGEPEPVNWDLTITEGTFTSGYVGLGTEDPSAAQSIWTWDDLRLTYPPLDDFPGLPPTAHNRYRAMR